MTTDKTPATLATAKHGGCVQLPTSERERFEAFVKEKGFGVSREHTSSERYFVYATQIAWESWQAALSAQPSPGGQGDALLGEVSAQLESLDCGACIGSDAPMEDLHGRIAAHLAARQPVEASPQGCDACDRTGIRQNDEGRNICCPDCDLGRACVGDTRQPVGEPVANPIHQLRKADGSWVDQDKHSYDYNVAQGHRADLRVVYAAPTGGAK